MSSAGGAHFFCARGGAVVAVRRKLCYNGLMETKVELYRPEDPDALNRKRRAWTAAVCALAAAALVVCVSFCLRAGAANAARMEAYAAAVSSVAGWVVIYLLAFRVAALRREEEHARRMLQGQRETVRGRASLAARETQIPRSIAVRSVTVEGGERTLHLLAAARRCAALERALNGGAAELELDVVGGYVAAFRVCHEST